MNADAEETHDRFLECLESIEPATAAEVTVELGYADKSFAHKVLTRLEQQGEVERGTRIVFGCGTHPAEFSLADETAAEDGGAIRV